MEPFDLEHTIAQLSIRTTVIATIVIVILVVAGAFVRNRWPKLKLPIFIGLSFTVIATTLLLAGLTIYLNVNSSSKGPVHWHADFEIWACDQKLNLRDPNGFLSNKIGTTSLHEHNDERIHLEGVVVEPHDASLGKFMRVVGGEISDSTLLVPLNEEKSAYFEDGQTCPDGTIGDVQVFVYSAGENKTYSQRKLERPEDFIIAPHPQVPPGDCIIIEFGERRDKTDRKCLQYQVQDEELGNYREVE